MTSHHGLLQIQAVFHIMHQRTFWRMFMKNELSRIGFAWQPADPTDREVCDMIDKVIFQTLGTQGLRKIIRQGDKVVLKVNLVGPHLGARGEKGRSIITDPRVVRYVAELVRKIIGFGHGASLKVVDATMYTDPNPSLKHEKGSFYWGRLERTGDNAIDPEDVTYDFNANGILDGDSQAEIVNLDGIAEDGRQLFDVEMADGSIIKVSFPKFLRTREQARNTDSPNEYTDVFIGLPLLKSHGLHGITGALKLHYGIRHRLGMQGDHGRFGHSGLLPDEKGLHNVDKLTNYLCAQHKVRSYDFCIMDCITANRIGPLTPVSAVQFQPSFDYPADYIITGAMMASTDPVALDTAEVALAGYEQSSIPIIKAAAEQGLGQNNPALIQIVGSPFFSNHRQFLWNKYNQKGQRSRYPLEDGHGGARAMKTVEPNHTIYASPPKKTADNVYNIDFSITRTGQNPRRRIVRVDLVLTDDNLIDFHIGNNIAGGFFTLDFNKHPELLGSDITYTALAWDDTFNCVHSRERFIIN